MCNNVSATSLLLCGKGCISGSRMAQQLLLRKQSYSNGISLQRFSWPDMMTFCTTTRKFDNYHSMTITRHAQIQDMNNYSKHHHHDNAAKTPSTNDFDLIYKTKFHQDDSDERLFRFMNHVLQQSNGEAFLYIFKNKNQQDRSCARLDEEENILSRFLQTPTTAAIFNIQNGTVLRMSTEQELLHVLSDLALYGGAYAERPENSLAESWATETIHSWKSMILKQSHNFNALSNNENILEFSSGISIDLYRLDSTLAQIMHSPSDSSSIEDTSSSLISRINLNTPYIELKHFFNGSMWDKIMLCTFTLTATQHENAMNVESYYLLLGITDKE
ncbi:hypothetical protein C9374_006798 [Naegleria lovaniensis]|uniref:Uncharacterized protein n=1 Tax=Naegleria lovaniensis TaxID=51637 RepID=A0AA88H5T7_NAELO|nr:uncharacterized protein C9374_006798 [Naegleria lovaniensis]KAG2393267.1 hypothetical protein C9374_006798 [Naegleria lovaniensis]